MSDREICGECKWHTMQGKGWYCGNEDSDYYMDWIDYTDTCPMFQERGVE